MAMGATTASRSARRTPAITARNAIVWRGQAKDPVRLDLGRDPEEGAHADKNEEIQDEWYRQQHDARGFKRRDRRPSPRPE